MESTWIVRGAPDRFDVKRLTADHLSKAGPTAILLIDDDVGILDSVKVVLASEGYVAHTASHPTEGLKFYEAHWREIDLVVLDFLMPIMRGDEVLECLQRINPDVRVILTTGCDEEVAAKMFERGLHSYLQKPFEPEELIDRVRNAIISPVQDRGPMG